MFKKLLFSGLTLGLISLNACQQNLENDDITAVQASKPQAEELAKKYNYGTVKVHRGFERFSNLLTQEDPTQASLFFGISPKKEGDLVNIVGVTDAKAKLGRVLFYDPKLSLNNKISCGSCHLQEKAFSDGHQFSPGFEGRVTTRNSMSIVSPGMIRSGMFWDRREGTIRDMALNPVQNHIEMGMEDLKLLEIKLAGTDYYGQLFADAYNSPIITKERISDAMTAFLRSMVTWDSKFDQGIQNNFANFSTDEKRGMDLFMGKFTVATDGRITILERGECSTCHSAPMFNDGNLVNAYYDVDFLASLVGGGIDIGLDENPKDKGAGNGGFKIPSLRNVAYTAPYMHDGRFKTLEEVVEHYNSGIKKSPTLNSNLRSLNGNPKRLNLSDADKKAIVAFMKTLSDENYIHNPKYSDPFKK